LPKQPAVPSIKSRESAARACARPPRLLRASGRRIFLFVRTLIALALFAVPVAQAQPSPPPPIELPYTGSGEPPESLPGPLRRADRSLEVFNRQLFFTQQNFGLNGRKNSTNDAAQQAETPRAACSGFSPWSWPPP
jgi:hypothetical protein